MASFVVGCGLGSSQALREFQISGFQTGVPRPVRNPGASGDICKAGRNNRVCCVGSLGGAKPPKEVVVKARSEGASGKGVDTAEDQRGQGP